jgi:two-component sensor histidine kinase
MKIRKAATPEARNALKEVQMRVMSIATVHRALYTTSTVGRVQADELLSNIVARTIEAAAPTATAVRIATSYDTMTLYPDQAVPLSLLVSEAVTNAMKYVGRPAPPDEPWIRVALRRLGPDLAAIEVENSRGEPLLARELARGTGLGANLIRAFAVQMRGTLSPIADEGEAYLVRVEFPIIGFEDTPVESELPLAD